MKMKYPALVVIMILMLINITVPLSFAQDENLSEPGIRVEEASICRGIESLEPIGAGDVFTSDQKKLICYTRLTGAREDTEIKHNWYFEETMLASVSLHVGSINWRTYSSKTILPQHKGEWKVEIVSQNDELLKRIYFIVE